MLAATAMKNLMRTHSNEMIIFGVMTAVTFVIGLAITGDVSEALARGRR